MSYLAVIKVGGSHPRKTTKKDDTYNRIGAKRPESHSRSIVK